MRHKAAVCQRATRSLLGGLVVLIWMSPVVGQARADIWAEASVSQDKPYVQESVIYHVRVYSTGNLSSVELTPPVTPGISLEELDQVPATTEIVDGRPLIVNEFRYALTPMASGPMEIGSTHLIITPKDNTNPWGRYGHARSPWPQTSSPGANQAVELATQSVPLDARSRVDGVQPWLPLKQLDIKTHWTEKQAPRVGQPLTLTITLTARGAKGAQLPSIRPLLETPDFKVYPERSQFDWHFDADGTDLRGKRVENYTLVPTRAGKLSFPSLAIRWWDVAAHKEAVSQVPVREIPVAAATPLAGSAKEVRVEAANPRPIVNPSAVDAYPFSILLFGGGLFIGAILGWWIGPGRPGLQRLAQIGRTGVGFVRRLVKAAGSGMGKVAHVAVPKPPPLGVVNTTKKTLLSVPIGRRMVTWGASTNAAAQHLVEALIRAMPARSGLWWCTRRVASEKDPVDIGQVLRRCACKHLNMSPNVPFQSVAERIIADRPQTNERSLHSLFQALDEAVYAQRELDIRTWKRDFRRGLRRTLASPARRQRDAEQSRLPALNP